MVKEANKSSGKPARKPHLRVSTAHRKWCRNGLIVVIVMAIVIIVLCQRPDWRQIGLGILAFVAGSALLVWTDEKKEGQSSKWWKWRKWLRGMRKWLKGILVPIILAVGGFLTTNGWNMRDNYFRDRAVLKALVCEWKLNDLHNTEIEYNEKLIRDSNHQKHQLFPLPTHSQITRAIDITKPVHLPSGQLSLEVVLVDYINKMDFLCVRLRAINRFMGAPFAKEAYAECVRQTFGKGDAYPEYLEAHRGVEARLRKAYPGFFEEVDRMKRKVKRGEKPADSKEPKSAEPNQSTDPNSQAG